MGNLQVLLLFFMTKENILTNTENKGHVLTYIDSIFHAIRLNVEVY